MRLALIAAVVALSLPGLALAQAAKPDPNISTENAHATAPSPLPDVTVTLTHDEAMLAGMALANSGAACDTNVQVYCQIMQLRASVTAKLQQALQTPAAATKK